MGWSCQCCQDEGQPFFLVQDMIMITRGWSEVSDGRAWGNAVQILGRSLVSSKRGAGAGMGVGICWGGGDSFSLK